MAVQYLQTKDIALIMVSLSTTRTYFFHMPTNNKNGLA